MKNTFILPAVLCGVVLGLGGCTATTGGMTSNAKASSQAAQSLQPSQPGDASMSCEQLTAEIATVDGLLAEANMASGESAANNVANSAINAGARYGIAKTGAASVVGKVPFGGSLLNSALNSRAKSAEKKRLAAQDTAQNAAVRRSSLMGIYTGKGC